MVAPFGQERGATPQGGPGKPGPAGRDGWPGPGEGGAAAVADPEAHRPAAFEAPPWSRLHRRPRRGVAARLPPGAVEALPEDLPMTEPARETLSGEKKPVARRRPEGARTQSAVKTAQKPRNCVGSDKRQLSIPIAPKKRPMPWSSNSF